MNIVTRLACSSLILTLGICAYADDLQKVTREMAKISAMSTDPNGRRVVSRLIADQFRVQHVKVLTLRRQLGLNYGSTFLFYQLSSSGLDAGQLATELRNGKTLFQVGTERQVKWGKVLDKTKAFNKKILNGLFTYFSNETEIRAKDTAENYLPVQDFIPADVKGYSEDDVAQARDLFLQQRSRASAQDPQDRRVDRLNENQIMHTHDQVRDGFPDQMDKHGGGR